jgi:hypothetical protein
MMVRKLSTVTFLKQTLVPTEKRRGYDDLEGQEWNGTPRRGTFLLGNASIEV